jgi:hypothetical protein
MRFFGISELGVFGSVEKWDRQSREMSKRILTVGCKEACGNQL